MIEHVGVVAIGRNEGERLRACLRSVESGNLKAASRGVPVIYVDSGSNDGSVELARSMGAEVVVVQPPFSAAKARNAGFTRLLGLVPEVQFVQFVDGDCTLDPAWLTVAGQFLEANPAYAAVAGRRRERYPERSVYNCLCDMEWNTPVGDAKACGGDAMFRAVALLLVGGYDPVVIAGEEPELCVRLRAAGWKIHRMDHQMTLHDAAMTHFNQWWRRAVRGGYGYALGKTMHGRGPERHCLRETRSIWFWGLVVPVLALGAGWSTWGLSLILLCGYPALGWRVYRYMRGRGFPLADSRLYAAFCVLAKFPQLQGVLRFWYRRIRTKPVQIIEYKTAESVSA